MAAAGPQDGRAALAVRGMWPYWFERAGSPAPVLNSISLDGVALLTGPNMAGNLTCGAEGHAGRQPRRVVACISRVVVGWHCLCGC